MIRYTTSLLLALGFLFAQAQHEENPEQHEFKRHKLAIDISHTHIPKARDAHERALVIVPSWALNYEFWLSEKWGLGLFNEMEIATYVVASETEPELERERPTTVALVAIYQPFDRFFINTGVGREFEKHENFWVYRIGMEYEIMSHNHWDISPSITINIKEEIYDSWGIGLAIGKRF